MRPEGNKTIGVLPSPSVFVSFQPLQFLLSYAISSSGQALDHEYKKGDSSQFSCPSHIHLHQLSHTNIQTQRSQIFVQTYRSSSTTSSPSTVISMSQSRIPQPSQGSSRTHTASQPPTNPTSANTTSYHGNPISRVCKVVFRNPNAEGGPTITVQADDQLGDLPGEGPTMDLYDDPSKNEGKPWVILISTIDVEFTPIGGGQYGIDYNRHTD